MRGRLVRMDDALDALLRRHDYPVPVGKMLAQAAALAAALGTSFKFDGIFTLQTKTDGPIRLLVVDVTSDGAVRACAQFDAEALTVARPGALLGKGSLVFTVDQTLSDERYQGIVPLESDDLTVAFTTYFKQSEQIPTALMAAADQDERGHWHAGCLMLQKMPTEGGHEEPAMLDTSVEDGWLRAMALMQTCTDKELTDPSLPPDRLLFRLFHEDGVRVYDGKDLRHECRCSQEKIAGILKGLPAEEIKGMVQEDGRISVTCQFCSQTYFFDEAVL